jgi:DNA sulfur modification protein DndD
MIINSISLENFRQFYGNNNKISFSSEAPNVIFATNGGGKSAILNAFTWAFYNSFSPSFKLRDQIVNKRAIAEANTQDKVTATVKIIFTHDGDQYVVIKSKTATKTDASNNWENESGSSLNMQSNPGDGNWKGIDDPIETIARIIPKDIHNYFFFDGERMEKMVSEDSGKRKELKNAANKLSGIEIIDRAIKHISSAANVFEKELGSSGNSELAGLLAEKKGQVDKVKKLQERNNEIDAEQKKCDKEITKIETKLKENQATKELQDRRDKCKEEIQEKLEPALNKINKKLISLISQKGYTFFTDDLLLRCEEQIEKMRKAGELPKGIKKQFVEDLLSKEQCICHSALIEGTEERKHVIEWRSKAGLEDVEERAMKVGGQIQFFKDESNNSTDTLNELKVKKRNLKLKMSKLEDELAEISSKLINVSEVRLAELENKKIKFEGNKSDMLIEFNGNTGRISEIENSIKKLDEKIQRIETGQIQTRLAQKRLNSSNESVKTLQEMLHSFQIDFKDRLQTSMQENFSRITTLPYYPVISDDFVVSLLEDSTGQPHAVGESTGESQVLSVTFILGLVQEIRNHVSGEEMLATDDNSYPIVMDSPFGQLGTQYRTGVAEFIPSIADQTIILVSETQWREEVENALESHSPKAHCLTYHNPTLNAVDIKGNFYGNEVYLQRKSDEYEWTSIKEL